MSTPVEPGDVVAEKYRVDRVLGRGGMGVVVAAEHLQLGQRVAIKFLLPAALGNADAVARFEREARAAVRLHSEHVARVLDVGRLPTGAPYMVIEYLEGADLASELETRGPLPAKEAVRHILQACDAIAEAHSLGIIHRDLKPANLFLARRPNRPAIIKVLDFGISKTTSMQQSASALTATSALMGSPLYMSPEQLRTTRDVDVRTDVWALGVTLYELLAGTTPFGGESVAELCANILTAAPIPLSQREATRGIPPSVDALVLRCLEKDPAKRFASVADLTTALEALAATDLTPSAPQPHSAPSAVTFAMASRPGTGPAPIATPSNPMPAPIPGHVSGPNLGHISSTDSSLRALGVTAGTTGSVVAPKSSNAIVVAVSIAGVLGAIGIALIVVPRFVHRSSSAVSTPATSVSAPPPASETSVPGAPSASAFAVASAAPVETSSSEPTPTAPSTKPAAHVAPPASTAARVAGATVSTTTTAAAPTTTPPATSKPTAAPIPSASAPAKKKSPLDIGLQ